jgi:hypothetical protein
LIHSREAAIHGAAIAILDALGFEPCYENIGRTSLSQQKEERDD